jgi:nicotinamide-nucleotide amidase
MKILRAGILTIGNEVLCGQILDGNAAFLGRELQSLGLELAWRRTVGDRVPEIMEAMRSGLARCHWVICSGGLGPTSDDVTRQAAARLFRSRLVLDRDLLEGIRRRFSCRGLVMPSCNRRQALVPDKAEVLPNPQGTAPGLLFRQRSRALVLLPGVPRELEAIWEQTLRSILAGKSRINLATVTLRTFGLAESALAEKLRMLEKTLPRGCLAYLPSYRGVDLRLTFREGARGAAEARCRSAVQRITKILGNRVYGRGQDTMEQVVGRALSDRGLTIFTVESCTGGLMADRLTDVPGSSKYFFGGMVAYNNRIKAGLLGVKVETLKRHGAVSRQTALEMARGGRSLSGCDLCLAATGIAGPGGAVPGKPVGLVFLAVSGPYGDAFWERRFFGSRRIVKEWAAQSGLNLVRLYLKSKGRIRD